MHMQQSKVIMGFDYEYTYHGHEYIIKIMNTKPAQCSYYIFTIPYTYGVFLHTRLHSVVLSTFMIMLLRQC